MVLSFTLGANLAGGARADLRELLLAALRCNLAWGVIDGIVFVMGRRFERNRAATLIRGLQAASDRDAAAIRRDLEDGIASCWPWCAPPARAGAASPRRISAAASRQAAWWSQPRSRPSFPSC
jgi:hypothetical protein